jgi:hypothetical protein
LSVVCCQVEVSADHSSRGVLPTVVRHCVWSRNLVIRGGHSPRWAAQPEKKKRNIQLILFLSQSKGVISVILLTTMRIVLRLQCVCSHIRYVSSSWLMQTNLRCNLSK